MEQNNTSFDIRLHYGSSQVSRLHDGSDFPGTDNSIVSLEGMLRVVRSLEWIQLAALTLHEVDLTWHKDHIDPSKQRGNNNR